MTEALHISDTGSKHILLMHANAYTPECYKEMCAHLEGDFTITAPYQRPIWQAPDKNANFSWSELADDIISYIKTQDIGPVTGIGHSMGSIALWLAYIKEPSLFAELILIEPVVLPVKFVAMNRFVPFRVKAKMIPIIKIAMRRVDHWSSEEELRTYLKSKKVFSRFDAKVFEDFVAGAFIQADNGLTLRYPKKWEAMVYGSA